MALGYYIGILTIWNIVMLLISYLFYRHICLDMNYHLKSRRSQSSKYWESVRRRDSSIYSNWGDTVLLNGEEESARSPFVESEGSYRRRIHSIV